MTADLAWWSAAGIGAAATFLLFCGILVRLKRQVYRKPPTSPEAYLGGCFGSGSERVLVCVGDSLTHGTVSCDYVGIVADAVSPAGIVVVNAGVNDELACNVARRIGQVVACNPAYVVVLIGTNDVRALETPRAGARAMKRMRLPEAPSDALFRRSLEEICAAVKQRTNAKLALLSIPPIGEDPGRRQFVLTTRVSAVIVDVARQFDATYLPLHEAMTRELRRRGQEPGKGTGRVDFWIAKAAFDHFVRGKTFDEISRSNRLALLTDFVHLNRRGAQLVADLVVPFVDEQHAAAAQSGR
jgi:acyl-CoA thioesterase-1